MSKGYIPRVSDKELAFKLETFGAVHITGPKGCGKSRSAEELAASAVYLQSYTDKAALELISHNTPELLLDGKKPRLVDEWHDAPALWDRIRFECDHTHQPGLYILTGSSSKKVKKSHTGTGRISEIHMYPMSLYETGESNGTVSMKSLFEGNKLEKGCVSQLSFRDLVFAICRGGWPYCTFLKSDESKLAIAKDYFTQIYMADMFNVDEVRRNSSMMESILRTYSRNISTLAKKTAMRKNLSAPVSDPTFTDYLDVLKRLYVVEELEGWCPNLRSSSGEKSGPKREFVDPSLAVAGLGTSPEKLMQDVKTLGFLFECLCIRDLRVYSGPIGGKMSYYHDRYDLKVDAVLHLEDGRYALIEFKLGTTEIEKGAEHLNTVERLIREHNENETQMPLDSPTLKIIITATEFGYRRDDGVYVIPIGCLAP